MSRVTMIPATINQATRLPTYTVRRRRTCGYARVSTDKDEQFTSYEAQVDYYTRYIQDNSDWEFVKVYTDEGISGTNTKRREGFNEMIHDAMNGKIDLIVTKSVSRFARNTVDSLVNIRKLKEKGVEVYFEKENIWTLDSKGELLLTIMSSLAQEESRSISENITWGKRKSASDGKISLGYSCFLGYDKGPKGTLLVNREQAPLVQRIYREFMKGKTPCAIADGLTKDGVPTPTGRSPKWSVSTVESILTNEKYKGAALLQKSFTVDYLTKKIKANEGEVPQYYVEDSHEAIIPPAEWERVQKEFARRRSLGRRYSGNSIFATKLVCDDCGAFYGPKVWNSTDAKYRRVIWQCNDKFKGEKKCTTPHVTEDYIKNSFVTAFNRLFDIKAEILENCNLVFSQICDFKTLDAEIATTQEELSIISQLTQKAIDENASQPLNQAEFQAKYDGFVERFEKAKKRLEELTAQRDLKESKVNEFKVFLKAFSNAEGALLEFNEKLWATTIEQVRVKIDGSLVFLFKNGSEVNVEQVTPTK